MPTPVLLLALLGCGPDVSITKQRIDADGDGYSVEVDCDDAHATVNPDAAEVCDGLDNDCDDTIDEEAADAGTWYADLDGDGYGDGDAGVAACDAPAEHVADGTDCDDAEAASFPGNPEVCDGVDNDCDGEVDVGATDESTWYVDADADGHGDAGDAVVACEGPAGTVASGDDCDDADARIHPDAEETDCTDPVDYNCDGAVGWADGDGDGWAACEDCDDADPARSPGEAEVCDAADLDEDCSGAADDADAGLDTTTATTWTRDADGDGWGNTGGLTLTQCEAIAGYAAADGDCDDTDPTVSPGAAEVCDAGDTDEDCDATADDTDASTDAATMSAWYRDADGDGAGDATRSVTQCDPPAAYVADAADCDDTNGAVYPSASEMCNGADDDCDGLTDDADPGVSGGSTWYADADADGFGDADVTATACDAPAGHVADAGDCDDAEDAVNPSAGEVCNGVDDDCDARTDDDDPAVSGTSTWYADADADGYGDAGAAEAACLAPAAHVVDATDCDDGHPDVNPAAAEVCNTTDDDCDGLTDDADPGRTGGSTWYADDDADGYGDPGDTSDACAAPAGHLAAAGDCDDANAAVNPAATETCNAVDDDCDGLTDDDDAATGGSTWYADDDADGYGDPGVTAVACTLPSGHVADATDCDDASATTHPGATETCDNGIDDDCAGGDEVCPAVNYSGTTRIGSTSGAGDTILYGAMANAELGTSVASGVDLDADGAHDLVVGAPGQTSSSYYGVAYVIRGAPAAGAMAATAVVDTTIRYNTSASYTFADKVYGLPDVDGDGYDEVVVRYYDTDTTSWIYNGESGLSYRGYVVDTVVSAGEFDDGYSGYEYALSENDYSYYYSNGGRVLVYNGTGSVRGFHAESADDYVGAGIAGGPGQDVDGDGFDDLVIGAYGDDDAASNAGAVYVALGDPNFSGPLADADLKITGTSASDQFGRGAWAAGDVDGDGLADVLVGAPQDDDGGTSSGVVFLFCDLDPAGSTVDDQATDADGKIVGPAASALIGAEAYDSRAAAGDVDGDGNPDVIVGVPAWDDGATTNAGAAYLIYGPWSGTHSLASASGYDARFAGSAASAACGGGVALGDLDGDGASEIIVGCEDGDASTTDVGTVHIFAGQ